MENTRKRGPEAPQHLSKSAKKWWRQIHAEYDLDVASLEILGLAADSLHRCEEARAAIQSGGLTVADRFGQEKAHPLIAVERDSQLRFAKLCKELGLLGEDAQ